MTMERDAAEDTIKVLKEKEEIMKKVNSISLKNDENNDVNPPTNSPTIQINQSLDVFKKGLPRPDFNDTNDDNIDNNDTISIDNNINNIIENENNNNEDNKNDNIIETDDERHKSDKTAKLMVIHALDRNGHIELIKTLSENDNNYHVVWRSARALREIIIKDDIAKNDSLSHNLDEILIKCMKFCHKSSIASAQCLRLIGVLSYGNDNVRRRVGERNGILLILNAMKNHENDETLQLHACTALTNLTHNSIDNRSRFLENKGVDILIKIMGIFIKNMKLQRQGCWAILTLAASDHVSKSIVIGGGGSAIISAMMEHRFDTGVQQFGAWALTNLAAAGDDTRRRLKINGALEVCRICMETYPNDNEVMRQARNAITTMAIKDD